MKKFKAESQKVLDIMINSIYTNKEIFIRELLSNASDAMDKLYYKSLTENLGLSKGDFEIRIETDKENRILKISDNGIGMTESELEDNLGIIAKSGSQIFKDNTENTENIDIIGQFGVGFYSAFMISDKVEVLSKAYGEDEANLWTSNGVKGYNLKKSEKDNYGTTVIMHIKADTEEEKYSPYLDEYHLKELVKKYSDYIRYPIIMNVEKTKEVEVEGEEDKKETKTETYFEDDVLNSMIPIWKKAKKDITEDDYNNFYKESFSDFTNPIKVVHTSIEGAICYTAVLFVPSKAPYNYYSKSYEKGLKLYNNGVMIMEKCADLLPDYLSFVKGVVDCDLTLNISRETIQQNYQLKKIATNIEKKIIKELLNMLENDRENYEKFFSEFGVQLKYGLYEDWGKNKEKLQDLIMFRSVKENKLKTFKEYVSSMTDEQKIIYYASGKSVDAVKALPQAEKIIESEFDILCLLDDVDEFAIRIMGEYDGKEFKSISSDSINDNENEEVTETDKDKEILAFIKESLGDKVANVILSSRLKSHPVCLSVEGEMSIEMEKVFKNMPNSQNMLAKKVLEINSKHPIYSKITSLFDSNKDAVKDYAKILLSQAMLIEGLTIENPAEFTDIVCNNLAN